jgi:regulator of protease activity HflC (stomatin/prohibitin superfamily)
MGAANFVSGFWEIIKEIWGWCEFITVLDEWEEAVQLRMGKFKRCVKAGWWIHWPAGIDEFHTMNVRPDAMDLDEQTLTTADDVKIVITVVLMWEIFDIKKCTLDVDDASETLQQIAVGFVHDKIEVTNFNDIRTKEFRNSLKRSIQAQARKWGITVSQVRIQDFAETHVYRLIGGL